MRKIGITIDGVKKVCPRCGEEKNFNEFSKSKRNKDGLCCYCRKCDYLRGVKYRKEHPEKEKAAYARYYKKHPEHIRAKSAKYYLEHREQERAKNTQWYFAKLGT